MSGTFKIVENDGSLPNIEGKFLVIETQADGIEDVQETDPLNTREEAEAALKRIRADIRQLEADERSEARGLAAMEGRMEDFNDLYRDGDA